MRPASTDAMLEARSRVIADRIIIGLREAPLIQVTTVAHYDPIITLDDNGAGVIVSYGGDFYRIVVEPC